MVAVLVVGGLAGWMRHVIRTRRAAVAAIEAVHGIPFYDWQRPAPGPTLAPNGPAPGRPTGPDAPAWLRRWLGDELFQAVRQVEFQLPVAPEAIAALRHFERLESVQFRQHEPIAADLSELRHNHRLSSLFLGELLTTDPVLGQIAQLDSLRDLTIHGPASPLRPGVTGAGFEKLARLPNLMTLRIEYCPELTDAAAARLVEGLPRLRHLTIEDSVRSVAEFLPALVRHHPDLESLSLVGVEVQSDDLRWLARLAKLEKLELWSSGFNEAVLAYLRPLVRLKYLRLFIRNPRLTDAGLAHLAGLSRLETLQVDGASLTDAGLRSLEPLKNLKSLSLSHTRVTDAGLPDLARLPKIEVLSLSGLPITDAGLLHLSSLPRLRSLIITKTRVTPAGVTALDQAAPQVIKFISQFPSVAPAASAPAQGK